jgi:hypothetical protein
MIPKRLRLKPHPIFITIWFAGNDETEVCIMNALVVFPLTMHNYSFSAPVGWLFSKNKEKVQGVYGFDLNRELVLEYDFFIVELNWFIQLYEFTQIVGYIKKINPKARILFGGLYSALKHEEIFKRFDVDLYIQGDNEEPLDYLLNDYPFSKVPNLIGRNFKNPVGYRFTTSDFRNLEFNLDWFPAYFNYVSNNDLYYMDDQNYADLYDYNDQYHLPMIITSKGGCNIKHKGCENCMGSKHEVLGEIYQRPPVAMDNETLILLVKQIEKKYGKASLFFLSNLEYDFSGQFFDIDMSIEIDANMPAELIIKILYAFPKCKLNIGIYEEGVSGAIIRKDYRKLLEAEDQNHRIAFFIYDRDLDLVDIPPGRRLYSEDTFPKWAYWDYYQDLDVAYRFGKFFHSKINAGRRFASVSLSQGTVL